MEERYANNRMAERNPALKGRHIPAQGSDAKRATLGWDMSPLWGWVPCQFTDFA
jgi:hypothetical protein